MKITQQQLTTILLYMGQLINYSEITPICKENIEKLLREIHSQQSTKLIELQDEN